MREIANVYQGKVPNIIKVEIWKEQTTFNYVVSTIFVITFMQTRKKLSVSKYPKVVNSDYTLIASIAFSLFFYKDVKQNNCQ